VSEQPDLEPATLSGSRVQWLLLTLFALSLVVMAITSFVLERGVDAATRHDSLRHAAVEAFTDLRTESDELSTMLVGSTAGLVSIDDLQRQHVVTEAEFRAVRSDLESLDDPTVDLLSIRMLTSLESTGLVIAEAKPTGAIEALTAGETSRALFENSHALTDAVRESINSGGVRDHISWPLRLVVVLSPIVSLVLLLALAMAVNKELRSDHAQTKADLRLEDRRRRNAENLAVGQVHAMELITAGSARPVVYAAVAEIVSEGSGGRWTVGPDGLVRAGDHLEPLAPELAAAADRILELVADRENMISDLFRRANRDGLTELHNRSALHQYLQEIDTDRGAAPLSAVLCMDLERFQSVNDTFGQAVGDHALRETARRVRSEVGGDGVVARTGGDEFAVAIHLLEPDAVEDLARRIADAVRRPIRVDGFEVNLGISIGASIAIGLDSDTGQVMADADHAMRLARRDRRVILFADDSLRQMQKRRRAIEERLAESFHDGGLIVAYQPVVDTVSGQMRGVEALARLRMDGEVLPPAEFIEVAEETGQIIQLDRRVIEIAARQVADWNRKFGLEIELAVNLSGNHVKRGDALATTGALLRDSPLPADLLVVEINEGVFVSNVGEVIDEIISIRNTGVRFAIDDFGTGYSSLAYLQTLPIDILKIDRVFVSELAENPRNDAIVKSILELALAFGLEVVAEGVETAEQLDRLRDFGCDLIQGYFFSRPVSAEVIEADWLSRR